MAAPVRTSSAMRAGRHIVPAIYILALLAGTFTHLRDIAEFGFLPYVNAPLPLNIYWTSLTFLDPLAIALLLRRLRWGVLLTLAIMLTNVPVNFWASLYVWEVPPLSNVSLLLQTAFLAFVLLTAPRLLRR